MFLGRGLPLGAGFYKARIRTDRHLDKERQPVFRISPDEKDPLRYRFCAFLLLLFPGPLYTQTSVCKYLRAFAGISSHPGRLHKFYCLLILYQFVSQIAFPQAWEEFF